MGYYKIVAIVLRKQQALDADRTEIQHINFTGNVDWEKGTITFFIIEEAKQIVLNFSQETV